MNLHSALSKTGLTSKLFLLGTTICLGVLCVAVEQHLRNNDIKRSCNLKTHKIVYVASPIGDQALCVAPNLQHLLKSSTRI